jgi:hypothetical protein
MNKYPLFSSEVNIDDINFSNINYNDNKQFVNIKYGESNNTLYIQSPLLKFIEPITKQKNNYKSLFLFLTPHDPTTHSFIKLINSIEQKSLDYINQFTENNLDINQIIKSYDLDTDDSKQIVMYIKTTLLDQTKIEYHDDDITYEELNNLVSIVNLKLIFEINMFWLSNTKIGVYLKPLKIKAIDISDNPIIDFRDDESPTPYDFLNTEVDPISKILNNSSTMKLNDSAFKSKKDISLDSTKLNNFIKKNNISEILEDKLINKCIYLKHSSSNKSNNSNKKDNISVSSDSSIRITELARKKNIKEKKRGRPKKDKEESNNTSEINLKHINKR